MADAAAERWTTQVARVLAPNAGPMTLDGTNSFVIGAPGSGGIVVVDPGPDDDGHLAALRRAGEVELILLTHHHRDHTEAAPRFAALTGAPVRALDERLCIGAPPLVDGERIHAAGVRIHVVATPGHTADSVSLHLPDDTALDAAAADAATAATDAADGAPAVTAADAATAGGTMLTGDTILGRGTTIIAEPDGSLADYLDSLARLRGFGEIPVLPAHGPQLPDLAAICRVYAAHRRTRLDEVRAALHTLDQAPSTGPDLVAAVTDLVYGHIDPAVRFAAEASVRAQLNFLSARG